MSQESPNAKDPGQPESSAAPQSPTEWIGYFRDLSIEHTKLGNPEYAARCNELARNLEDGMWSNYLDQYREDDRGKRREWEAQWAHYRAWQIENLRGVLDLARATLKGFMLVNAGAIVALLAFLGNVWDKGVHGAPFITALSIFAGGLFMSVLASGLSYITQSLYSSDEDELQQRGKRLNWVTIGVALLSLVLFAAGVRKSIVAFRAQPALQERPIVEAPHARKEPTTAAAPASKPAAAAGTAASTPTGAAASTPAVADSEPVTAPPRS